MAGRRRMKSGYSMATWCNRVDELGAEVWQYMAAGKLPQKEAVKVAGLLEEAAKIVGRRERIRIGVQGSGRIE